ncbi:MAG TPA: DUF998 domain-containing protein [Actinomycetales bacterium]|nr:DUF998 domain-containing protein [Actinomycetales bacterium]
MTPALGWVGAAGFTATWVTLGFVSPGYRMWDIVVSSYSPVSQPISGLGLGVTAPYMNSAFVVFGLAVAAGAWAATGSWRRLVPGHMTRLARPCVAATGIGMILCGLFDLESMTMHSLGFLLAVGFPGLGLLLAGVALRRVQPILASALLASGAASLLLLGTFLSTFDAAAAGAGHGVAGLVQRLLVTVVLGAVAVICWGSQREPSAPAS